MFKTPALNCEISTERAIKQRNTFNFQRQHMHCFRSYIHKHKHTHIHIHSYDPKTIVYWQALNDQYFFFNLKNFYLYNQWFSMEKLFYHTNTWSQSLYNAEIGVSACGLHKKLFYYIFTVFNFFFRFMKIDTRLIEHFK